MGCDDVGYVLGKVRDGGGFEEWGVDGEDGGGEKGVGVLGKVRGEVVGVGEGGGK